MARQGGDSPAAQMQQSSPAIWTVGLGLAVATPVRPCRRFPAPPLIIGGERERHGRGTMSRGSHDETSAVTSEISQTIGWKPLLGNGGPGAGRAGALWWVLDLASHWRVQYLLGFVVVAAGCLLLRSWRWAGLFGLLAVVEMASVLPLYLPPEGPSLRGGHRCPPARTDHEDSGCEPRVRALFGSGMVSGYSVLREDPPSAV